MKRTNADFHVSQVTKKIIDLENMVLTIVPGPGNRVQCVIYRVQRTLNVSGHVQDPSKCFHRNNCSVIEIKIGLF